LDVPYFVPWITKDDKKNVNNALNQRWLTNGPFLQKFEKNFQKFIRTKYAVGVGSATQALHLSLRALGIKTGDEVIVPTFTFAATANSALYCGAKPIFVDIDRDSFNISPREIEKKITKKTKAIIPVHYGGQACNIDEILRICKNFNLFLIEDCAHSLGSTFKNRLCGSFGNLGCFSFYATKVITTAEGGMVTTNSTKLNKKIRLLRSQAMSIQAKDREKKSQWKYDIIDLGYNYRLDEIRSALGVSQLQRIEQINKKRINIAKKYNSKLKKVKGIIIPKIDKDRNHIFHLYTIKIEKDYHLSRNQLFQKLAKAGIGTSVQYNPLHLMSYYEKKLKINKNEFPNANKIKDRILCLPIYPTMSEKQVKYVVNTIISN